MNYEVENIQFESEGSTGVFNLTHDGGIIFSIFGREVLKLCNDGRFLVEGRPVTTDVEVYRGFKAWLESAINSKTDD